MRERGLSAVTTKLLQRAFELDQRADDNAAPWSKTIKLNRKRKAAMTKHAHRCGWSKRTK